MRLSQLFPNAEDRKIRAIVTDSEKVTPGALFVCLKGEHTDGHRFAEEALAKGAVAIVTEERLFLPYEIIVPDTHREASRLFSLFYGEVQKELKLIGVTGTNGKTSVSTMLDHIYRASGHKTALIGTLGATVDGEFQDGNNTTPLPEVLFPTLRKAKDRGVDTVFLEVSSHALATHRVADLFFETAIYTNLTGDHLDYHKTMEVYAEAKASLFRQCRRGIFYYDDPYSYYASQVSPCERYGYGSKSDCDFQILPGQTADLSGIHYRFSYLGVPYDVTLPIIGDYQIANSLSALAAAILDGIAPETAIEALKSFRGVKGRAEVFYRKAFTIIIDYAHTPDALFSVLSALKEQKEQGGRLRVLFGCGGDRDKTKRPKMGHIASLLADEVILTSDNARSEDKQAILDDICSGISDQTAITVKVTIDRREALRYAVATSRPKDILLVAGKGHEEYEIDRYGKRPFSERQILKEHLAECGFLPSTF